MRVFVAGATGAIGRPLVRQLIEAGHEVTGTTRSEERAAELRARGAEAVVVDAHDAEAFREAVRDARPEVLVHQLTDLPQNFSPRYRYGKTNELRSRVTRDLIAAGREASATRVVAQSIAFIYVPTGDMVKDEEAPTLSSRVTEGKFAEAADATLDMERQVVEAEGMDGLVLRYGFFYGPGTWYAPDGDVGQQVRRRRYPIIGDGSGVFSFVHIDDAAAATVAALTAPPGVYNVVDDEPVAMAEWLPEFADALGAKRPMRAPRFVARLAAGRGPVAWTESVRGASNAKARAELGWSPRWQSWRRGFRHSL